jgi:hypothetical protein
VKSSVIPLSALSSIVVLMCCPLAMSAQGNPPPPVCQVFPSCGIGQFPIYEKTYQCPNLISINSPIQARLECISNSLHSMTCEASPFEAPTTCSGSGTNLIYDWAVKVGSGVTYPYPPSYDNLLSISCIQNENVNISVTVWNGSQSSIRSTNMRCGQIPE